MTVLASLVTLLAATGFSQAYWLMAPSMFHEISSRKILTISFADSNLVTERLDPVISAGQVSSHVHTVVGGSNFGPVVTTASLRESECTSIPIAEDKSNYWFPNMWFQWANGSLSNVDVGVVIYYLFSDQSNYTTAFPDDFRMISGTPGLRSYNGSSYAQEAVSFLCLDYATGVNAKTSELPNQQCPDGVRSQIVSLHSIPAFLPLTFDLKNFPSCWDGKV